MSRIGEKVILHINTIDWAKVVTIDPVRAATPSKRATAFAVSAATVGAAGALNTGLTHFISPDSFPVFLSLSLLVGVALAGPRSSVGTFVAAVFLSFVPYVAEKLSQEFTGVLYGAVMLGAVFVLPQLSKWRGRMAVSDRAATPPLNPIDMKEK